MSFLLRKQFRIITTMELNENKDAHILYYSLLDLNSFHVSLRMKG